jgi:hypothetical protein
LPCDHLAGKHAQALKILVDMTTNIMMWSLSR